MKLKTFVEEIEIKEYNLGVDAFFECLAENMSEELGMKILTEDIAGACVYKDGKIGFTNNIDDNTIAATLPRIKTGDFNKSGKSFEELTNTPRACIAALVAKITGLALNCPAQKACNKLEDNQTIKDKVMSAFATAQQTILARVKTMGGMAKKGAEAALADLTAVLSSENKIKEPLA